MEEELMTPVLVDDQLRLDLYRSILRIRLVELAIEKRYPENEMRTPIHSAIGQEGVAAGVCAQLSREDLVFGNHRSHAHYLAKGGDLRALLAELYNRETGCARGRGGSMHLLDPAAGFPGSSAIVGGGIALATGAALAFLLQGKKAVAVTFFGDGAAEEGILYESINFVALKNLPVIYVCENNGYAVSSPLSNRQKPIPIFQRFQGFAIPCRQVDGNDAEAVCHAAGEAVDRARGGEGPSFIECLTYRFRDHHGTKTGVEAGYQTKKEWEQWQNKCPLKIMAERLTSQGLLTPESQAELIAGLDREINEAFDYARAGPFPDPRNVGDGLYG
jgi:TPP-dependent pyruvate/acetoin dehydrogenase alpha subunit